MTGQLPDLARWDYSRLRPSLNQAGVPWVRWKQGGTERIWRIRRLLCCTKVDPLYCDVICRRFEALTGQPARLATTGQSFGDVELERDGETGALSMEAAE